MKKIMIKILLLILFVNSYINKSYSQIEQGDIVMSAQDAVRLYRVGNLINTVPSGQNHSGTIPVIQNWMSSSTEVGPIFGITHDANNNLYFAATSLYGIANSGPGGFGKIYKIDNTSLAIDNTFNVSLPNFIGNSINGNYSSCTVASIVTDANVFPGLGNICYDKWNNQLFVTNHEDGKIYRISITGAGSVLSSFDPMNPDDGVPGFCPLGERIWGINCKKNGNDVEVYYSVWSTDRRDYANSTNTKHNTIRRIKLNSSGDFDVSSDIQVLSIAYLPDDMYYLGGCFGNSTDPDAKPENPAYSNPVSDITFSKDGNTMLLAEHTMFGDRKPFPSGTNVYAHGSRILQYNLSGTSWNLTGEIPTGNLGGSTYNKITTRNSAGGVAFGAGHYYGNTHSIDSCETTIWGTSDAMGTNTSSFGLAYGFCGISLTKPSLYNPINSVTNKNHSWIIDHDNSTAVYAKGHLGDIEFIGDCQPVCPCNDTLKPYLLLNEMTGPVGGVKPKFIDLTCGSTYTDKLSCFKTYSVQVQNPCGDNCQPDEVITTIQFIPAAGSGASGYTITGTNLIANTPGKYVVTVKVKCNGKWCKDCIITFIQTKKCEPPCDNCKVNGKDKVQAAFNAGASSVQVNNYPSKSVLNASIAVGGGTDTYTQVRVNVVDVQVNSDNPNCLQCYSTPNYWGSIVSGSLPGFIAAPPTAYNSISAYNTNNNPRELVFNAATPTTIPFPPPTAMNLSLHIPGTNPLSCCCINVVVYLKVTFRNNKCEECSKIVRIDLKECGGKGGEGGASSFTTDGGHPQYRQHVPSKEDAQEINNTKNN